MKTKILLKTSLFVVLTFALAGCESEKEEKIQWSDVPAVVQETITENTGDGEIEEIERETKTKNGKPVTVYEVEIKKSDGKKIEIKVGEDGKLIKVEDD
jgi:uncharacterized membrane protein YkoI